MNDDMIEYYARRAAEYERIYQKPERQNDLHFLVDILKTVFKDRDVLEIACGTGYWTQFIAESAHSILATDYNQETLEIAKHKNYKNCKVTFEQNDAYSLSKVAGTFTGGFCGFWWSHIPNSRIQEFLLSFHSKLQDNALVVMMDNKYVEGSSTRLSRTDEDGNTYQNRRLQDGSLYEVLKNFPTEDQIRASLEGCSRNLDFIDLEYYWLVKYQVNKT